MMAEDGQLVRLPPERTADTATQTADTAKQAADTAGRPLRADARRNREKVLHAAREAFAASGFGVPLDEIAARAGVGPGTVYRHFPTKEALFEAVVADARRRSQATDPGEAFFGFLARIGDEARVKRDLPDAIAVPGPLQD